MRLCCYNLCKAYQIHQLFVDDGTPRISDGSSPILRATVKLYLGSPFDSIL